MKTVKRVLNNSVINAFLGVILIGVIIVLFIFCMIVIPIEASASGDNLILLLTPIGLGSIVFIFKLFNSYILK